MATRPRTRAEARKRRHRRVRKKVFGTAERPRLAVFRSHKHTYAQIIRDDTGETLVAASTLDPQIRSRLQATGDTRAAHEVGRLVAERALASGIRRIVLDRGGYLYHGRVKAVAEGAREAGLEF